MNILVLLIAIALLISAGSTQDLFLDLENETSDADIDSFEKKNEFSLDDYVPHHPLADNSTYGNIDQIYTTHFHLSWDVNFRVKKIQGTITHDLTVVAETRVL